MTITKTNTLPAFNMEPGPGEAMGNMEVRHGWPHWGKLSKQFVSSMFNTSRVDSSMKNAWENQAWMEKEGLAHMSTCLILFHSMFTLFITVLLLIDVDGMEHDLRSFQKRSTASTAASPASRNTTVRCLWCRCFVVAAEIVLLFLLSLLCSTSTTAR